MSRYYLKLINRGGGEFFNSCSVRPPEADPASHNKSVPDSAHAPYPLRYIHTVRDDHRRRGNLSAGVGSDLIVVRLRRTVRWFLDPMVTVRLARAIPLADRSKR